MSETPNNWERFVPWYLTIISAMVLIGIGWFLVDHIVWLRGHMFEGTGEQNLSYRSHQYFLLVSTMRRSAGLFSGISLILLGVGVVFYVAKTSTELDFTWGGVSLGIVTASPGIIAMALGTFLVAHNTASKDLIPIYGSATASDPQIDQTIKDASDAFEALTRGGAPSPPSQPPLQEEN